MPAPESAWQGGGKMKWKMGNRLVLGGFAIATAILVFVGWQSYRNTARFAEASDWQKHTYEVLRNLDEVEARLVDAETGQRGYLLTGEEAYLEPYRTAIKNIDQTIGSLKNLTSDNPNQQKRIQILESLVENKLAELQRTIDLRKNEGLAAANRVVLEGSGKQWMDQIRAVVAEMTNEEEELLKLRTQRTNESVARSVRTILAGTLLSISLLVLCFGLLQRQLSERKKAQAALAKSEKWFSTTLASIGDAVIATDMNGAVTFMNSVAQSLTGWTQREATGKSMDLVFDIVNKETRRPVENPVKKVFREGKVVGLADHTLLLSKDHKEFDIEDSAAPILTDTGEGFGVVLVFRDISEKKRTEEETKRQKELLQLILGSIADGVVVADSNGKFLLFNAAAEQVLGLGATDTTPDQWSDRYGSYLPDAATLYPPNELPLVRAMRGESVDAAEVFIRNAKVPDGRLLSITGRPLRGEDGALQGGVVVFHDVTLQKRAEEALIRAKEEAERSNKFKDQFLSTMSHELRTPLNAVVGFSDLLTEEHYGPLNDRQKRYVNHIKTGGKHLLSLINDILDLSKIEAGRLQLAIESVPIKSSFADVIDIMRPLADKKSQTLVQHGSPDVSVRADSTRFKQVLMNLLGNAIKFTPDGGKIELAGQQLGEVLRVEVRDSGPGIPPEELERIFEAFHRLGQTDKATEGTGLGLAITKRLVELHGGHLGIESRPGSGSCFYFTLPIVPTLSAEGRRKVQSRLSTDGSPRILVVEDDHTAAQLLQSQLISAGYEVVLCDQPDRAVEIAAELRPSAVTIDILMGSTNGWELLSKLKSDPRTAQIPAIVVTIVDQPGTGALLGADEYIVKPVERATLLAAVERCLHRRGRIGQVQSILVVEDDGPTREFIAELLSKNGYAVGTAANGTEARAKMAASLPELVILDLILPEVSGFQLLAEWRLNSRTADLPVFVLTSKDLSTEERDYIRTNAGALFHKQEQWQDALVRQLHRAVPPVLMEKS
jgi:PAS domain S-box-containing protein